MVDFNKLGDVAMKAGGSAKTGATIGTAIFPGIGTAIGGLLGALAPIGMSFLSNNAQQKARNAEYDAIVRYLEGLDRKRAATEGKFKENYEIGDTQFNLEANTPLAELTQMKQDITDQSTVAQQNMNKQLQSQLSQQGVRGGQAATQLARGTGQLNRELNWDVNQLAYDEAKTRQGARLDYTSKKALIPYNTLNTAKWLYMPDNIEMLMMNNAIKTKYGV